MITVPKVLVRIVATLFAFIVLVSLAASAQCSAPASAGVRICTPTPGSTVAYPAAIEFNSRAASGASITKVKVYDNYVEIYATDPGETGTTLISGSVNNGTHHVSVVAWDTAGHVYKAVTDFTVIGQGLLRNCSVPSTAGVNFCTPRSSDVLGLTYPVLATAKGSSAISSISVLLDGKVHSTATGQNVISDQITVPAQGYHDVTIIAKDTAGHTYNASRVLHSAYTYGDYECDAYSCNPGILVGNPEPDSYKGHTFGISAKVEGAKHPITSFKAYLDSTEVASVSGSSISKMVSTSLTGTHIISLEAWDSTGAVYLYQYNVNIAVAH